MIQIEKHGNIYPSWRCSCLNCGCQFTFDDEDIRIFGKRSWYRHNSLNEIFKMIRCPECSYHIDEAQWDKLRS